MLTEVAEQKQYFDPETFVYCNILSMDTEDKQDKMIEAIEKDKLHDISKINLLSVYISRGIDY